MIAQYMPKYTQHMPNLSPKYAKDVFQIGRRYAQKDKAGLSHHNGVEQCIQASANFVNRWLMVSRRQRIGDSGYCRTLEHRDAGEHRTKDNHLTEDKNINHFKFTLRI